MKKCFTIISAALLMANALTGCAGRDFSSEKNNAVSLDNEPAVIQTAAPAKGDLNPGALFHASAASAAPAAYEKLIAYKSGDYGQQSIADFNAALASTPDELTAFLEAVADVMNVISPDDENYDFFTTTMSFSADELYCGHRGEEFTFYLSLSKQSKLCGYLDEEGDNVYDFNCFVDSNVAYSIDDPKLVTVAERDQALLTFKEEMQNYLNSLSEEEIRGGNIKRKLIDKSAELADRLSTKNMKLSPCEIYMLDIIDAGEEIIP